MAGEHGLGPFPRTLSAAPGLGGGPGTSKQKGPNPPCQGSSARRCNCCLGWGNRGSPPPYFRSRGFPEPDTAAEGALLSLALYLTAWIPSRARRACCAPAGTARDPARLSAGGPKARSPTGGAAAAWGQPGSCPKAPGVQAESQSSATLGDRSPRW